jgi:hypothetical protein
MLKGRVGLLAQILHLYSAELEGQARDSMSETFASTPSLVSIIITAAEEGAKLYS